MNVHEMWYLEGINLFGRFCPLKSKESVALNEPRILKSGEMIYLPKDPGRHIHIVLDGRVRIGYYLDSGEEVTKAILSEGEVFGELALAGEIVRSEFAESMDSPTRICMISIDEVMYLMHTEADMSLRIIKWMGLRMIRMERQIALLTFKDARTRIIEFLKDAAAYKGKAIGEEMLIKTRLTHSDIAKLTGTSRQTVNEIMNRLRAENQIFFERGKIILRNQKTIR